MIYTPDGADTVTLTAVYLPAATETFAAIKFVSDCRRVNSKFAVENTETGLPLEGESVIPMTGKVKLATEVFVGAVSETVRLREAFPVPPPPPPPPPLLFSPLQEASGSTAIRAKRTSKLFEFMQTPR